MEVTQTEARKLHCPFGRQQFTTSTDMTSANRWQTRGGSLQFTRCLGERCMLWISTDEHHNLGECGGQKV